MTYTNRPSQKDITDGITDTLRRLFGYESVYLPLYKMADTPFHIQKMCHLFVNRSLSERALLHPDSKRHTQITLAGDILRNI